MDASIIIVAGDGVAQTIRCLQALAETVPAEIAFEVVLVDDGTRDGTSDALRGVEGDFVVVRNDQVRGPEASCGQAALIARGEVLAIMRQDAIARPGWLEPLLAALADDATLDAVRPAVIAPSAELRAGTCLALRRGPIADTIARARATVGEVDHESLGRYLLAFAGNARLEPDSIVHRDLADGAAGAPAAPALRDVTRFGSFLASGCLGEAGPVLLCPSEDHACQDLVDGTPIALVLGEISEQVLAHIAQRSGLVPAFRGVTATITGEKTIPLTVLDRWPLHATGPTPEDFRVVAIMTAYNERDIICQTIRKLLDGGVDVHLVDNWSTDGTFELVQETFAGEAVSLERFPAAGPSPTYDWEAILTRVDEIAQGLRCDWVMHQDADEIRQSPWLALTLREAIHHVDRCGFSVIDHTVLNFRPTDDGFVDGTDLQSSFSLCEFPLHQSDFVQMKAWRRQDGSVALSHHGGHRVSFAGARVFPYKFLLRHYPIRSQRHGQRKVLRDRRSRWNESERARGWHVHYDHYREDSSFLWSPGELLSFDESDFMATHLVERLSGVGTSEARPRGMGAAAAGLAQAA